ncbi:helix-turn-helix domain-containing protein [Pantoea agglomerans]|uniref:helix-turn-helix domain-containing protein n=1 Tax=Enterobacter agglomerans TaxID=549 RepID=UPI000E2195A2|nr:helix-turn-helix domain-containing protein [Pantoea agglomerans]MCH9407592.1 helix-turn-helix domain-containing protein [Pantoea agglomerans]QTC48652.1 helix-turn-helix domain-containing protein [Pantoea agglomerans]WNK64909.1 helix-turn-helix domain-containing protein [Pantoea agglomerans]
MYRVTENHERIIDALAGYTQVASPDEISRGKRRYHLTKDNVRRVMFILDGDFLIKLKSENKVLNILSAPFVVGVTPALDEPPVYLERIDYGKVSFIDYDVFWRLVFEKDLFNDAMSILSGQYSDLMNYIQLTKNNSHDEVISLIGRWEKLPPHLKKRFSALYLIENSSHLSKSSICRVLKELKEKGELTLINGKFT